MNSVAARCAWNVLKRASQGVESATPTLGHRHEQSRGIRVKVMNGNLEWALTVMQRKMTSSGIERMIKREQTHHLKKSEKRILARKNLEQKLRSQDLARKLKAVLLKKVRREQLTSHGYIAMWHPAKPKVVDKKMFTSLFHLHGTPPCQFTHAIGL